MNREFKFRVWDISKKRFLKQLLAYESNTLEWDCDDGNIYCPFGLDDLINRPKFFIVQQFTGLKDENNKEIYEGDILETEITKDSWGFSSEKMNEYMKIYVPVIFKDGCFCGAKHFVWHRIDGDSCLYFKFCKVVGNIFENSELLN